MDYLILDTSGSRNFISSVNNDQEKTLPLPQKELTKVVHKLLISLEIKSLDFIAICSGPGFFTGIRIGVSIAKALSYSKNIPLIPFHSLELLDSTPCQAKILDARGGKVYAAYGDELPFLSTILELPSKLPLEVKELITMDASTLSINNYTVIEQPVNVRKKEKIWGEKLLLKQVEDYQSLKIEYLH